MIGVESRDIKALEKENVDLREWLAKALDGVLIPEERKQLERINYQLTALGILARKLWEQNQILETSVDQDIMSSDMPYLRPASTV